MTLELVPRAGVVWKSSQYRAEIVQWIGVAALPTERIGPRVVKDRIDREGEFIRREENGRVDLRGPQHQRDSQHDATHETLLANGEVRCGVCAHVRSASQWPKTKPSQPTPASMTTSPRGPMPGNA